MFPKKRRGSGCSGDGRVEGGKSGVKRVDEWRK